MTAVQTQVASPNVATQDRAVRASKQPGSTPSANARSTPTARWTSLRLGVVDLVLVVEVVVIALVRSEGAQARS